MRRGGRTLADTSVVRSGPDTRRMRPVIPQPALRGGSRYLLVYLGIMGPQDTVDQLVDVMEDLVIRRWRSDVHLTLLGFGDCLEDLKRDVHERGLDDYITFTGRVGPAEIADYLSTADLGLGPDLKTPLSDVSTMNKTLEYMAYGLPAVAYELAEVSQLVGDAAALVPSGDTRRFADEIEMLLADTERRVRMGMLARERVTQLWDWRPQSATYVNVFDRLAGHILDIHDGAEELALSSGPHQHEAPSGQTYINLEDRQEFANYIRNRGRTNPQRATA
jgi:glycosyltransferase involved in cell wall biosynthesis